jgi:prepilin-type N-terminal cleavage/methylation domain-containing protein
MKKKAFTLVELLVVISIIAVLLAVLMPALNRAREMSRTVICQTNLKQLGTAWAAYTVANNGLMVSAMTYSTEDEGDIGAEYTRYSWVYAPMDLATKLTITNRKPTLQEEQYGIKQGKLFPYASDFGVFHCPSDKTGHFRSYTIPDSMNGQQNFVTGSFRKDWDSLTKIAQVKRPSEKYVVIEEDDTRDYNMNSWLAEITAAGMPTRTKTAASETAYNHDPMAIRHNGLVKSCFAFADGHGEQHRWSDETVKKFAGFKKTGGTYIDIKYTPTTEGGKKDIEWLYNGWARLNF